MLGLKLFHVITMGPWSQVWWWKVWQGCTIRHGKTVMDKVRYIFISSATTIWWRHQMETFSALLALCAGNSPVTGEFPSQRAVTPSFDVFFDLRLNKRLSKQSRGPSFEMQSRSLWRHCNVVRLHHWRQSEEGIKFSKSHYWNHSYRWLSGRL